MGLTYSYRRYITEPELQMDPDIEATFDPHLGFDKPRKERKIDVTKEQLIAAKIPPDMRDYCSDVHLKVLTCRHDNFPFLYRCKHQVHEYNNCQYADYVIRMKEYERERRLRKLALKEGVQVNF